MRLYDSLSETIQSLPEQWRKHGIRLFVCGPTVYDYSHIGHARTYIAFDALVRWLRYEGYEVFYLQNITDVDDKIIDRANRDAIAPIALARRFEKEYRDDMRSLNITTPTRYARASDHINHIIKQTTTLIQKGHAYQTKNGVYFDVSSFPEYGKLSKQAAENTHAGARIAIDENKKNPHDFALWKNTDTTPFWDSPWGKGRPGWHIEDTAITEHYFGPQYEMHGGASELKFPHHEAEIAQQECASGKSPLVAQWIHTGILLVDGKKMSKSDGNFVTIRDFLSHYPADVLRLMVLSSSYRSPIDYSPALAESFNSSWYNITTFITKLLFVAQKTTIQQSEKTIDLANYQQQFTEALEDDFNTPKAIATLFSLMNETEESIVQLSADQARAIARHIRTALTTLGFIGIPDHYGAPLRVVWLAHRRTASRAKKDFTTADTLRNSIEQLGYTIDDTPLGTFIHKSTTIKI